MNLPTLVFLTSVLAAIISLVLALKGVRPPVRMRPLSAVLFIQLPFLIGILGVLIEIQSVSILVATMYIIASFTVFTIGLWSLYGSQFP